MLLALCGALATAALLAPAPTAAAAPPSGGCDRPAAHSAHSPQPSGDHRRTVRSHAGRTPSAQNTGAQNTGAQNTGAQSPDARTGAGAGAAHRGTVRSGEDRHRLGHTPRQACSDAPGKLSGAAPQIGAPDVGATVLPHPSAAVGERTGTAHRLPHQETAGAEDAEAAGIPGSRRSLPQPPPVTTDQPLPGGALPVAADPALPGVDEADGEIPTAVPFSSVAAGTYLPLGMGMSLIGFGVALVGLRLRRR
ncbi:hypothetical protein [Peterkaempfera sp. SMS 1(5)a]|uniref:hypothetical protein n=1 Tax=Peterkaempfera podocarpi TaxID=3232308 RepID=UPI00367243D4